jgi:hypothetical protein
MNKGATILFLKELYEICFVTIAIPAALTLGAAAGFATAFFFIILTR